MFDNSTACGTSSETSNNTTVSGVTIDLNGYTLNISSGNNVYLSNVTIQNGTVIISQGATFVTDGTIDDSVVITNQN